MNVTRSFCGDPEPGRSALDGYEHVGTWLSIRFTDDEVAARKRLANRRWYQRVKAKDIVCTIKHKL
jgi:hypothetical protein